jgi:large subunit ribosomal protein L24
MSKPKLHIKRGDTVQVLAGKEKGKKGKVLLVSPAKKKAVVEALNMATRHERPSQRNPQGGLVEKEAPIHISNLMLVCAKCGKPTRVSRRVLGDGSKARECKRCSEIIDAG